MIEGFARVVAEEGGVVWLEPEQTASCGTCMSASACGHNADHGRRLAARRFPLANDHDLAVGERVVIGIAEGELLRASATAYGLPLVTMLGAGITAQFLGAGDGIAAAATLGGLAGGLLLARLRANRLSRQGALTPRFLRRAGFGGCGG
ncbi:MAG: SoxR reducing system RseC family protein [Magnetospirillum sp.]|nr:SoxR reducing system RseC family protein [Magnetospirillum sp.]